MLKKLLITQRGDGILSNEAVVYQVTNEGKGITELMRNKKDILSFSFQYGAITFPAGKNLSGYLPVYNIGTTKNDLSLVVYKL
jgi:hypothetical protein